MMTRRLPFLALATMLLSAACSGGTPSSTDANSGTSSRASASAPTVQRASTGPDVTAASGAAGSACELLSNNDIAELTPFEVNTVEAMSAGGIYKNGCHWTLVGGPTAGVQAEIILGVLTPGGREHFDTVLAPYAEATGGEPLEGVGDVGFVGGEGDAIVAVDDDVLVDLQWIALSGDPTEIPVALVERVLANHDGD